MSKTKSILGYGAIGNDMGGSIRAVWWCPRCREEYLEPRGAQYWAPVVEGLQSKRCTDGTKLRRIG